jgi:cytochrome b561
MTVASPWTAPPAKTVSRYSRVAMAMHWIIAGLIATQLGLGWYMNEVLPDHSPAQSQIEAIHISVGLTLLLVVAARIAWRLLNPPPPLPDGLAPWERILSKTIHAVFYLLMVILPLTGWALVSGGKRAISFWGLTWPKLPGVAALTRDQHHLLKHSHVYILIWILVISWFLHVGGALKHQFDGKPVLWRMIPFLKPPKS